MAKPRSRQELADYCLRALGAPVVEINIDDDQLGDRIDEAIQYYQEYHADATIRRYRKHQITGHDITNEYITLLNKNDIKVIFDKLGVGEKEQKQLIKKI